MPKFYKYRTHKDNRRAGSYNIFPSVEGDANFTIHPAKIIPKELHMHKKQTDYFTVAKGKVLFRLIHKNGKDEQFVLSDNDSKTLIISPGIWHGYTALEDDTIMVFYISHKYDEKDEFRKEFDLSGWKLPQK